MQLKNTQLKYQRVNDESYTHKVESNSKDAVICELELQVSQQVAKIQQLIEERSSSEDSLKSKLKQL